MLKVHESDGKQFVTAPFRSACGGCSFDVLGSKSFCSARGVELNCRLFRPLLSVPFRSLSLSSSEEERFLVGLRSVCRGSS